MLKRRIAWGSLVLTLLLPGLNEAADLRMVNALSVREWGPPGVFVQAEGTWVVRNPAPDRLNPSVVRIECRREYQGWQDHEGPECQEVSASIYPLLEGDFAPDLSFSHFRVQSWTKSELTAMTTEGLCDMAYVLRINFGEPESKGLASRSYPRAVVTKTKTGPLSTDGVCGEMAKDYRPYTMVLMGGAEAQGAGKLWWPFAPPTTTR